MWPVASVLDSTVSLVFSTIRVHIPTNLFLPDKLCSLRGETVMNKQILTIARHDSQLRSLKEAWQTVKVDAYTSPPSREGCAPVSPEKVSPWCLTVLTSWLLADGSPPGSEGGWEFQLQRPAPVTSSLPSWNSPAFRPKAFPCPLGTKSLSIFCNYWPGWWNGKFLDTNLDL